MLRPIVQHVAALTERAQGRLRTAKPHISAETTRRRCRSCGLWLSNLTQTRSTVWARCMKGASASNTIVFKPLSGITRRPPGGTPETAPGAAHDRTKEKRPAVCPVSDSPSNFRLDRKARRPQAAGVPASESETQL